jgi:hypothetical protein
VTDDGLRRIDELGVRFQQGKKEITIFAPGGGKALVELPERHERFPSDKIIRCDKFRIR